MRKPKRRKKSKLIKTLEEGDLLFNLVISVWLLILAVVFSGIFKIALPYKVGSFISTAIIASLSINVIFKMADIYLVFTAESLHDKIIREIKEKKDLMRKP